MIGYVGYLGRFLTFIQRGGLSSYDRNIILTTAVLYWPLPYVLHTLYGSYVLEMYGSNLWECITVDNECGNYK